MTRVSNGDAFSPASPEKTDKKDKETFGQPDQKGLPPRSYFDSVAQRSQALEKQRKKKPEKELKDKDKEVKEKDKQLRDKDKELKECVQKIADKDRELKEKERELKEKEKEIRSKEKEKQLGSPKAMV